MNEKVWKDFTKMLSQTLIVVWHNDENKILFSEPFSMV